MVNRNERVPTLKSILSLLLVRVKSGDERSDNEKRVKAGLKSVKGLSKSWVGKEGRMSWAEKRRSDKE